MMDSENWGLIPYEIAWKKQTELFDRLVDARRNSEERHHNRLVFCEHPNVYTLGRHGKNSNMLISESQLKRIGAELFYTDRGGDITYHGPGQLVCYPILCLDDFHLGLKAYVHILEEAVIAVCASFGLEAGRVTGATGVWLGTGTLQERKICAIGVRSSHFVTMHGLALNVNTDLDYFKNIHPCGFVDKGVTSLAKELGYDVDLENVRLRLEIELRNRLIEK